MVDATRDPPLRYEDVLTTLYASRRKGIKLGLEGVRAALEDLGLQDGGAAHLVQIAGTNGKGSTAQFLASILAESGIRVGVFSSPHLLSLCERFAVGGAAVSREVLVAAYTATASIISELTFFEQATVLAAWIFKNQGVQVAIFEVGLGGRLDSTSALDVDLGVVTGIALDHCEYLGTELSQIAEEKAAIFREGARAIVGLSAPDEIRQQLRATALRLGATPLMVDEAHLGRLPERLKMLGAHQRENAACAVAAALALREAGLEILEERIAPALSKTEITGRLQEVQPGLWLDGAHNAQAAEALAAAIAARAPGVMVVGLSTGKDGAGFLTALREHCDLLILTETTSERAASALDIRAAAKDFPAVEIHEAPASAIEHARRVAEGRPILVTGSLLLLGEVLALLGLGSADPFVVSDPGPSKGA